MKHHTNIMLGLPRHKLFLYCLWSLAFLVSMRCKQESSDVEDGTVYLEIGEIERLSPVLDAIISPDAKIEVIADGYNWSEGPVWSSEQQMLLFSDVPENTIFKWTQEDGASPYLSPSGFSQSSDTELRKGSNGLAIDKDGRLILCQHGDRQIGRMVTDLSNPAPEFETLASQFEGKRFNSPNDLTIDRAGNIYFTDPPYGLPGKLNDPQREIDFQGVFRVTNNGEVQLVTDTVKFPNGIALSLDESKLFVAESNREHPKWWEFELDPQGNIISSNILMDVTQQVESSMAGQLPDGMKIDKNGNLFATGPDGVFIFSPEGEHLGTIKTYMKNSNCAFNEDSSVLFVTCDDKILRIALRPEIG